MNKLKLFIENFLVYGIGSVISKIIPLLMVPVVTRLMPDSDYYGISDLSNTVVQFGSSFAVMGMYDAMYRMFFEKDDVEYKKSICSTALVFTYCTSFVIFIVMILFRSVIAQYFFGDQKYGGVVYLSAMATLVGATNTIISAPTRMQNRRKIYLITNTVSPILSYAISIPLLLKGHYVIALPLAAVISGITMEASFGVMNRDWFSLRRVEFKLLKQLLIIAVPLLPNFLIYWIFNSCDKLMITNMIGIGAAGVYSVGSKLGHCSNLIYLAFAGGWQFFAFSTMKEENQVKTNTRIYEYLGLISFVCTAFICICSYPIFKILFTEHYLSGYIIAPYLFLAPLLQMLYQVGNNQFLVIKKTWPGMFILSSGAVVNVILNFALIPVLGIEGAAISTLAGYIVTDVVDIAVLIKCRLMRPRVQFFWITMITVVYMIAWRLALLRNTVAGIVAWIVFVAICMWIYREDLKKILSIVRKKKSTVV